ncbi:FtsB family cell division protein [Desulfatitalea tepidiphila]|uniref:FtsB family cell division protein n=1 Tax=Desulfatitalea tepidiphila TaxID=1185843 RepID=UPI0006B61E30|nr:septum formation initiator family protein [Desulfatitalea tepidiphila]
MNRKQKISIVLAGIAMFYLLLVIVFGDNGWLERRRMQSAHAQLVSANEALTQEILQMYRTIDRLQNDPAFLENVARQELGMIRSDELIFKFKSNTR